MSIPELKAMFDHYRYLIELNQERAHATGVRQFFHDYKDEVDRLKVKLDNVGGMLNAAIEEAYNNEIIK